MSAKLTPWFPSNVKPARPGVYERQFEPGHTYQYSRWNGRYWLASAAVPQTASLLKFRSCEQNEPWRGLAKEPK